MVTRITMMLKSLRVSPVGRNRSVEAVVRINLTRHR